MILSDRNIREQIELGNIKISPYNEKSIQPASIEVHLGNDFLVFDFWKARHIDVRQPLDGLASDVRVEDDGVFVLPPNNFVLGATIEYIQIPDTLVCRLEGKSSLGRLGLLVHATAGYVDPGFQGTLTFELSNLSPLPIHLYPGMAISQLSFHMLLTPAAHPYGSDSVSSKYQGQIGPIRTRYYQEFAQGRLMPPSADFPGEVVSHPPEAAGSTTAAKPKPLAQRLKEWYEQSELNGHPKKLADAIDAAVGTVEGWIYDGIEPSKRFYAALFSLTQLSEFNQQSLMHPDHGASDPSRPSP